jgi:ribonuclease P protein component
LEDQRITLLPAGDKQAAPGTLRRAQRIRANADFQRVYKARKSIQLRELLVAFAPNGLSYSRLGVSVSTKHGNAVQRNRIKRVFRAAFREAQNSLPTGFDFVFIPRKGCAEFFTSAVKESLINAARKIN